MPVGSPGVEQEALQAASTQGTEPAHHSASGSGISSRSEATSTSLFRADAGALSRVLTSVPHQEPALPVLQLCVSTLALVLIPVVATPIQGPLAAKATLRSQLRSRKLHRAEELA